MQLVNDGNQGDGCQVKIVKRGNLRVNEKINAL